VHGCKEISVSETETYSETIHAPVKWIRLSFGNFEVSVFDRELEDLRAALYRYDMERHDAD
jgi:hypothetical protein